MPKKLVIALVVSLLAVGLWAVRPLFRARPRPRVPQPALLVTTYEGGSSGWSLVSMAFPSGEVREGPFGDIPYDPVGRAWAFPLLSGAVRHSYFTAPISSRPPGRSALQRWAFTAKGTWQLAGTMRVPVTHAFYVTTSPNGRFVAFCGVKAKEWGIFVADWRSRTVRRLDLLPQSTNEFRFSGLDLACGDDATVYRIGGEGAPPNLILQYRADGRQSRGGPFDFVRTNRAGAFGIQARILAGRVEVIVTPLSGHSALSRRYLLAAADPLDPGSATHLSADATVDSVINSDDGEWWAVNITGPNSDSFFPRYLLVWRAGEQRPCYALGLWHWRDDRYDGLPLGLAIGLRALP